MRKPKINTRPVANNYAASTERIIEFSAPNGEGGLISIVVGENGHPLVLLYRLDANVEVQVSHDDPK